MLWQEEGEEGFLNEEAKIVISKFEENNARLDRMWEIILPIQISSNREEFCMILKKTQTNGNCLFIELRDEKLIIEDGNSKEVAISLADGKIIDAKWTWSSLFESALSLTDLNDFENENENGNCLLSSYEAYPALYEEALERLASPIEYFEVNEDSIFVLWN